MEFAIIVPVLMFILFGVLDLGRLFHAAIVVTNAARAGARYGIIYPLDAAGAANAVQLEAVDSGIDLTDPAKVDIQRTCPDAAGCISGHPLRVTVTYQFELITGWAISPGTIEVVRSVEMLIP